MTRPTARRETVTSAPGPAGRPVAVDACTLDNGRNLAVRVLTYGATLLEVLVPDRDGRTGNVVLTLPDPADYQDRAKNPYVGATVGRYCRCVAGGRLPLDGTVHQLDRNVGGHHIHGGTDGFDRAVWTAELLTEPDRVGVLMRLTSPDGDQGYPGEVSAEAAYLVTDDGRLIMEYRATTTASTIVGLTNHAFWNLAGTGTIGEHLLALNTDRWVAADEDFIPLPGPPRPVIGWDPRTPAVLGDRVIDQFFTLDDPEWAAELTHPGTGRSLVISTGEPGIGVYTGDFHPTPRGGICLETGAFPDAPNRPDFPSARLDPGQEYRSRTTCVFRIDPA
jgi:aldose 1-epimerase